jgi:hypothetical protein
MMILDFASVNTASGQRWQTKIKVKISWKKFIAQIHLSV